MILITGATGFLGKYLTKELAKSHKLRCLARKTSNTNSLIHPNIEIFYGDVTDLSSLKQALSGTNLVIHLATVYGTSDKILFNKVNVEGTENLIEACKANNIRRIIYISSVAAIRRYKGLYGNTKLKAETVLKDSGLDLTILRPELIYGDGGKEFEKIITFLRKFPIIPIVGSGNYKRKPVYVGDVVSAIIACINDKKTIGKSYNLVSSEEITFNELLDVLSSRTNIKKIRIKIPVSVCLLIAKLFSMFLKNPPLTIDEIYGINQDITMDNKEAVKDLNLKPITFKEGIEKLHLS